MYADKGANISYNDIYTFIPIFTSKQTKLLVADSIICLWYCSPDQTHTAINKI